MTGGKTGLFLIPGRLQFLEALYTLVLIFYTLPLFASATPTSCLKTLVSVNPNNPLLGKTLPGTFDPVALRARALFSALQQERGAWNNNEMVFFPASASDLKKRFQGTIFERDVRRSLIQVLKSTTRNLNPVKALLKDPDSKPKMRRYSIPYKFEETSPLWYEEISEGYDPIFSARPISTIRSNIANEFRHIHLGKKQGPSLGDLIEKGSLTLIDSKNQTERLRLGSKGLQVARELRTGIQLYFLQLEVEKKGRRTNIDLILPPSFKETPMSTLYFSIFVPRTDERHREELNMHLLQSSQLRDFAPGWYWRERSDDESIRSFFETSVLHHRSLALFGDVFSETSKERVMTLSGPYEKTLYSRKISFETGTGDEIEVPFMVNSKTPSKGHGDMTVLELSNLVENPRLESDNLAFDVQQKLDEDEILERAQYFRSLSVHHKNFWDSEKGDLEDTLGFPISPEKIQYLPFRLSANKAVETRSQKDLPDLEIVIIMTSQGSKVFMRSFLEGLGPIGEFKEIQNLEILEESLTLVSLYGAPLILQLTKDDAGGVLPQFDLSPDLEKWVQALNYSKAPIIDLTQLNLAIERSIKIRSSNPQSIFFDFFGKVMPEIQKQTALASRNELNVTAYSDILDLFHQNFSDSNYERASPSLLRRTELEISSMVEKLQISHRVYATALNELTKWSVWVDQEKKQLAPLLEAQEEKYNTVEKHQLTPKDLEIPQKLKDLDELEWALNIQVITLKNLIQGNSFLRKKLNFIIAPMRDKIEGKNP